MISRRLGIPLLVTIIITILQAKASLGKSYTYLTYSQLHYRLTQLTAAYPNLIRLYSAQDRFSLPHVGNCSEQSSETAEPKPAPCTIWVVELTNFETIQSDPFRPEILISGELHGDEIVGPHAVLAYIEYVAENYETDPFVKRMVDSRLVTLVPMTNAIGFHRRERQERQNETIRFDPNRDFGFDQKPDKCMQTVAARALNELTRVHLYRILVTFHGGTNVVGYEWGDTSHCTGNICKPAPDMKIMRALAERMSDNAGPAGAYEAAYPIGDMGSTVYSVNGGLEDWAYGASWAKEATSCEPSTLGGYPKERTRIERTTKRCVTYLVETAREKKPVEHSLGTDDAILTRGGQGDGHVPRNVRLILTAVDAAEPYIVVDDEIKKGETGNPVISWRVGGAFIVDGTMAQWSTKNGTHVGWSEVTNGTAGVTAVGGKNMNFQQELQISLPSSSQPLYVRVAAVVDRDFMTQPNGSDPNVTPQSHLMGSRGSTKWSFNIGQRKLEGRRVFFSQTLKITSQDNLFLQQSANEEWGLKRSAGTLVTVSENELLDALLNHTGKPDDGPIIPSSQAVPLRTTILTIVIGCTVVIAIALMIWLYIRRKRRRQRKAAPSFTLHDDLDEGDVNIALTASQSPPYSDEEEVLSASAMRVPEITSSV